jgi:phage/plasmid-like protein (TIGR03299 family)
MLTKLTGVKTAEEALAKCGLLWGVRAGPVYDATGKLIPTHVSLTRSDTGAQLSIVKKSYQWVENGIFGFMDGVVKKHNAEYISGGVLDGGKRVFLQLSLGGTEIQRGDELRNTLIFFNSFDATTSFSAVSSSLRLVCSNQLTKAIRDGAMNLSIRHTSGIQERTLEGFRLFDMSVISFQAWANKLRLLARKNVNDRQVKMFLDEMIPDTGSSRSRNARNRVVELHRSGKGNNGDSMYSLLNGYVEHQDFDGGDRDSLAFSRLLGYRASEKARAVDVCLAL